MRMSDNCNKTENTFSGPNRERTASWNFFQTTTTTMKLMVEIGHILKPTKHKESKF